MPFPSYFFAVKLSATQTNKKTSHNLKYICATATFCASKTLSLIKSMQKKQRTAFSTRNLYRTVTRTSDMTDAVP